MSDRIQVALPSTGRRAARSGAAGAYTPAGAGGSRGALLRRLLTFAWLVVWLAGSVAALGAVVDLAWLPSWAPRHGAAVVTVMLTVALSRRSGGRVWFWTLLGVALVVLVLLADTAWLYSSAAVYVAAVGGVAAVLLTRPAPSYVRLLFEYVIALLLATSAGLAVAAYEAPVSPERYNVLVLAVTLAGAMALVWRLGAGFHGLGRRGALVIVAGAILVTALLVYSRVLREYGSTSVTTAVQDLIGWLQDTINGVPRPIEVLVGFPALLWGVHTRAHRRQGWWMCAFGTFGTATVATTLAGGMVDPAYAGRSLLYSVGLGLLIGLVVIKVDDVVVRHRAAAGRRVRREEADPEPLRPEPGRSQPLR